MFTLGSWVGSDKSSFSTVGRRAKVTASLRREPNCLVLERSDDKTTDPMQSSVARKCPRQALSGLTRPPRYYSVCLVSTGYRANRAGCANTLHGSNPTLNQPVFGLQAIIASRKRIVLLSCCSPHDSVVGAGCIGFSGQVGE
jgi:hypothetical protein